MRYLSAHRTLTPHKAFPPWLHSLIPGLFYAFTVSQHHYRYLYFLALICKTKFTYFSMTYELHYEVYIVWEKSASYSINQSATYWKPVIGNAPQRPAVPTIWPSELSSFSHYMSPSCFGPGFPVSCTLFKGQSLRSVTLHQCPHFFWQSPVWLYSISIRWRNLFVSLLDQTVNTSRTR